MTATEATNVALVNPTRLLHYENPKLPGRAWCGAPVQGVYSPTRAPVECVVCEAIWTAYWLPS